MTIALETPRLIDASLTFQEHALRDNDQGLSGQLEVSVDNDISVESLREGIASARQGARR